MSRKNRVRDWQGLSNEQWRQQVASDLDELDGDLVEGLAGVATQLAEVKEQLKWSNRTMWGLLVSLMLVLAGIVTAVTFP